MGNTTIPAELVAINAIQGTLIADNAITSVHIAQNNVTAVQIAINAVTATQIADGTITSAKIADGTIVTADIADGQITTTKLADSTITSAKIASAAIGSGDVANNAILTQHIDDNQVTADQIADNAVGIGQLAGIARGKLIVGDSSGDPSLLALGAANTLLTSDGTDAYWSPLNSGIDDNSNAVAITINSSEQVGIGVTAPVHPLHLYAGSGGYYASMHMGNSTPGGTSPWLGLFNNISIANATYGWGWYDSDSDGSLQLWNKNNSTTGAMALTIKRGGNVGIGLNNPSEKLQVVGNMALNGELKLVTAIRHANSGAQVIDNDDDTYLKLNDPEGAGRIFLGDSGDAANTYRNTTHKFEPASGTEYMRINATGVGIGITPSNTFSVGASGTVTTRYTSTDTSAFSLLQFENSGSIVLSADHGDSASSSNIIFKSDGATERMRIDSSGKVGIGTASPSAVLEVAQPSSGAAIIARTNESTASQRAGGGFSSFGSSTAGNRIAHLWLDADGANFSGSDYFYIHKKGNGGEAALIQQNNADLKLATSGTTRITISGTGNVGIGTATPDKKLEVAGTDVVAKFTGTDANPPNVEFEDSTGVQATIGLNTGHDFIIDTAGENVYIGANGSTLGSGVFTVLSTGKVGIATVSPASKLEVGVNNTTNGIALRGGANGNAIAVEVVDGKTGSFSSVTIDIQYPGAGGYGYQIHSFGTGGSMYQSGGGYTNGTANFSHNVSQTNNSSDWTVSSPSANLLRVVKSGVGTHPGIWVKAYCALSVAFDESDITITYA